MNSLNDKQIDRQLDQMLSRSVGADAAPFEFSTAQLPNRPQYSWVLWGSMAVVSLLLIALCVGIALLWEPDAAGVSYALSDGIYSATEHLTTPTNLFYAAAAMAAIYAWFARKIIRLYRYY